MPFGVFDLVPLNLNKCYGILNHVLALVPLSTFLNGLSATQINKTKFETGMVHYRIIFDIYQS